MAVFKNIFALRKTVRCNCPIYLGGKTALVTGASSGIGFETARILAGRGARVIIADKENLEEMKDRIIWETHNRNIHSKYLDLEHLDSVREFSGEIRANERRLDILINNAGVGGMVHRYTDDLLQVEMEINHFSPFLLTHLLIDLLRKSQPSRIIFVSSILAYVNNLTVENLNKISDFPIMDLMVYSNSKLCNIITAQEFAERLQGQGVTCNSLHPGFVVTDMYRKMRGHDALANLKKIMYAALHAAAKTPTDGAQTVVHLALSDEVCDVSGKFFMECKPFDPPEKAKNKSFCESIWKASENFVHLRPFERLRPAPVIKKRASIVRS